MEVLEAGGKSLATVNLTKNEQLKSFGAIKDFHAYGNMLTLLCDRHCVFFNWSKNDVLDFFKVRSYMRHC